MEKITSVLNRRINTVLGRKIFENVFVDCIFVEENADSRINKDGLIVEAKTVFNQIPGVKHYTYRIDKQLGDGGPGRQRHIHIYYDGNQIFALNADATAHDGCHQVRIPDDLVTFLNDKGFPVPANNIIEFYNSPIEKGLLCEGAKIQVLSNIALSVGESIRRAEVITIIESNVETYQVKTHSAVVNKYHHVNQLVDIPQEYIGEIKQMLIDFLKKNSNYCDDRIDILDSKYSQYAPHKLYVAWS